MSRLLVLVALFGLVSVTLAACGVKGPLTRPVPETQQELPPK